MSPDVLSVALRALSFVWLLQAAGIAIFIALFRQYLSESEIGIRKLGLWSAVIALPLLIAQYVLEAARMADDMTGVFDPSLQHLVLTSSVAVTLAVRAVGLAVIAAALVGATAARAIAGLVGSLLVAVSFALMGHTAVHPWRPLLGPAVMAHVFIAAFWFGALPALYIVTLREAPDRAGRVIEHFSRLALRLVPTLALVGLLMAVILVRRIEVFREPYGWLLIAKVFGFTALMGLAAANKSRLGPAVAFGNAGSFRRSLVSEYALILGVLAATATMTSLFSLETARAFPSIHCPFLGYSLDTWIKGLPVNQGLTLVPPSPTNHLKPDSSSKERRVSAQVIRLTPRKLARRAMPVRLPNSKLRTREYLTPTEVRALITAALRRGRYGQRDACLILLTVNRR